MGHWSNIALADRRVAATHHVKATQRAPQHVPSVHQGSRSRSAIPLLWIDDEICDEDAAIPILELEGFFVSIARSGADGISAARSRRYSAIVLDLKLPDVDGLEVLARLRAANVTTPVIVLSGFLDVERASAAVRLGVSDLRSKPLFADELVEAVRRLLHSGDRRGLVAATSHGLTSQLSPTRVLLAKAAVDLTRADLSATEFLSVTWRFRRQIMFNQPHDDAQREVAHLWTGHAHKCASLEAALTYVEQKLAAHQIPTLELVADHLYAPPREVAELFARIYPSGFRAVRRALRLRRSLALVAFTVEQYDQIAYVAGYEHPSQFSREFHKTFGLAPHEFRAIVGVLQIK